MIKKSPFCYLCTNQLFAPPAPSREKVGDMTRNYGPRGGQMSCVPMRVIGSKVMFTAVANVKTVVVQLWESSR